ncbi:MAG: hypothetical protein EOP87_21245, partial [Verrucomicrobiaceae bacterium]
MKTVAFLLLSVCLAAGDVAEVRLLSCSPEIATAMRANLDGGKLTAEAFEKAYDRLSAGKQIQELGRFRKDDWVIAPGRPQELAFTSAGWEASNVPRNGRRTPNQGWEHQVRMSAGLFDTHVEFSWHKISLPPGGVEFGLNSFELEAMTVTPLPSEAWQIMDETTYGSGMIVSLFRYSAASPPPSDPATRLYWAEGLFLIASEKIRDEITAMDQAHLQPKIAEWSKAGRLSDFFRIRAGSNTRDKISGGSFFRHRMGAWETDGNKYQADKVTTANMTLFGGNFVTSPDATGVEFDGSAKLT